MQGRRLRGVVISIVVVVGAIGLLTIMLFWHLARDQGPSLTTDTSSTQLQTSAERVAFLGRYLRLRGPVVDAAFHIVWHDNSQGLPGPSDWSVVAALQVSPTDGPVWLSGARPVVDEKNHSFAKAVLPSGWNVRSAGSVYVREGVWLNWHPEGVLEVSASTN